MKSKFFRYLLLPSILFGWSFSSWAQENLLSRTEKKMYEEADIYFEFGDFHTALELYKKLLDKQPENFILKGKTGKSQFKIKGQELLAENYFKTILDSFPEASFYMGKISHLQKKFNDALLYYQRYKTYKLKEINDQEIDRQIEISQRAKQMIDNPVNVTVSNLGSKINSPYQDYVPLITADESALYFTSRRPGSSGNLKDPLNEFFEDIYIAKCINGQWLEAENIGKPVNSNTHDATVSLSSNESTLIFYRTNENLTAGDLYASEHIENKWTEPVKLGENINSDAQESSACLSPDERTIIFSSNRSGGFGGKDLYRSVILPNGQWSLPVNLGPSINTPFDEDAPYLHIDGKTLYFSSNGQKTMGGYDIFKSYYNAGENRWENPQNLGYPINTVNDDIYFTMNASGSTGYYSTEKDRGFGRQDIYKISLNDYENE